MPPDITTRFATPPDVAPPPRTPVPKALAFAWAIELFAVGLGLLLAIYAGLEGGATSALGFVVATLPFVALALIELTKIPLVGLLFGVRSRFLKAIGALALVAVTVATFENFVFGFERGFNERLLRIGRVEGEMAANDAEARAVAARIAALDGERQALERRVADLREEREGAARLAREDIEGADARPRLEEIAAERRRLDETRRELGARRDAELAAERVRCARRVPNQPPPPCGLRTIEVRYAGLLAPIPTGDETLRAEAESLRREATGNRTDTLARRNAGIARAEERIAETGTALEAVRRTGDEARGALSALAARRLPLERDHAELVSRSQVHRLAEGIVGGRSAEQVETVKRFFVLSLSAIVALIGTVIALLHYAAATAPPVAGIAAARRERRPLLRNALRAWIIGRRRRRRLVREVVREVPVDRLKIVYLPLDAPEAEVARLRRDNTGRAA